MSTYIRGECLTFKNFFFQWELCAFFIVILETKGKKSAIAYSFIRQRIKELTRWAHK